MSPKTPRSLYIFTGKGGVGKTTLSLSFCQYLKNNNHNPLYIFFKHNSLLEDKDKYEQDEAIAKMLDIPSLGLSLEECAINYITNKFHSHLIAKGIVKTPFFRTLINMIPGFNYLIYLGQILQMSQDAIKNEKPMVMVLDSPSSGHALTMLEATSNFQKIFQSGILFDDTQKMLQKLYSNNFCKINIITLPSLMALNESCELIEQIKNIVEIDIGLTLNNSLSQIRGLTQGPLPDFIQKKMAIEQEIEANPIINNIIPHSLESEYTQMINDLLPNMESLV